MARPNGFAYEAHPDGTVHITHQGRRGNERTARAHPRNRG